MRYAPTVLAFVFSLLLVSAVPVCGQELAAGVRGLAIRAPEKVVLDGDLSEFKHAFCTPINYFHPDWKNRSAQFFYLWDDEAFYAGLRTLDEKRANHAQSDRLWEGDGVEWYFDTRRGENFRSTEWTNDGAVHCYWVGLTGTDVKPRFCLRPGYLDAIPKIGVQVAARETEYGTLGEFEANQEASEKTGNFVSAMATWPVDLAPPGGHQVTAIVYDPAGQELTRIAPRLVSTSIQQGY